MLDGHYTIQRDFDSPRQTSQFTCLTLLPRQPQSRSTLKMKSFAAVLLLTLSGLVAAEQSCPNGVISGDHCCIGVWSNSDNNGKKTESCIGTLIKLNDPNYSAVVSSATAGQIATSTWSSNSFAAPTGMGSMAMLGLGAAAGAAVIGAM